MSLAKALKEVEAFPGKPVFEELLIGEELSMLVLAAGEETLALAPAQDFKRAYDGDQGPNTGGMGSYSPVPGIGPAEVESILEQVHRPVLAELAERGHPFIGVLYAGLMRTDEGIKVLEFNVRFGDPETQAILPRIEGDLLEALAEAANGSLEDAELGVSERGGGDGRARRRRLPGRLRQGLPDRRASPRPRQPARSSSTPAPRCATRRW